MSFDIIQEVKSNHETVVSWRRALHQIPEVGIELPQTVAFIAGKLAELNIPYEIYEDCSCITATIGKGGKCILLRGDMDGLPVAEESGLDGIVCSPLEAGKVHDTCGKQFLTITPGVRFADGDVGDQKRVMTPAAAKEIGSDYIVVGRPITAAADPVAAYERCVAEFCD